VYQDIEEHRVYQGSKSFEQGEYIETRDHRIQHTAYQKTALKPASTLLVAKTAQRSRDADVHRGRTNDYKQDTQIRE
jgi:hypothetical protein